MEIHLRLPDGALLPNPKRAGDLAWKLRYCKDWDISYEERLQIASILSVYIELINMPQKLRNKKVSDIRRALKESK